MANSKQFTRPDSYYEDFDDKKYDEILFRDGEVLQGREFNNMQKQVKAHVKGIGDALFADGDIVSDAQIVVNAETGHVLAQSGAIYLDGAVRSIPEASFVIPTTGVVTIGVYLTCISVSEKEDPSLYNPAVGNRGEAQRGAWRKQCTLRWGMAGEEGEFYPVHTVEDGVPYAKDAPPNLDSFNQAIGAYDRRSTAGGTYICEGLEVRASEDVAGKQIYTVTEGKAQIYGHGVNLPTSRRLTYAAIPDLRLIETETTVGDGTASQRVTVAHPPIHTIQSLFVTQEKTVTLIHGSYSGAQDTLPDTGIVKILACKQGDTRYEYGTDFIKTGDAVDWSPSGNEPAPGSTYECVYTYTAKLEPIDADYDGFTVENAVKDSSIIYTYNQALPRLDRLCLTQEGKFQWVQGVASERNPRNPAVPEGVLALATVYQTWREPEARIVENDGDMVVSFSEMKRMDSRIDFVVKELSRQRLESDISMREAGARVGVFVDPFLDDSLRDQGIPQTAAVFGGEMTLSIAPEIHLLPKPADIPAIPDYTPVPVLSQLFRTGSMQVNPYMAFDPLPAKVTLKPAVDQWTEVQSTWTSPTTEYFNRTVDGYFHKIIGQESGQRTDLLASSTSNLEYLRQIEVEFTAEGFGNGERLTRVTFDGIDVATTPEVITANAEGVLHGKFTIPPNVPAGAKTVTLQGAENIGTRGEAVFVGQGKLTTQTLRKVNTITNVWIDPLAQTFVLDTTTQICGVDLWFTAKGSDVRVQIREVQNGVPSRTILAEAFMPKESIVVSGGGHTRFAFPVLVQLLAATEYAVVVMCDDPDTAVAIAEMGQFDNKAQTWVSSQPYTVGVLLSSSNASTWTAHQTKDLTFRLLKANFTNGSQSIVMGTVDVQDTTDFVVLSLDETPTASTRVEYVLDLPDGNTLHVAQGQVVRLPRPVKGQVQVTAHMTGTKSAAPLIWPGAQLLAGLVSLSDDYYSRSIPATSATRAILIYDAHIPSNASVVPEIQLDSGEWQSMPLKGTVQQGDGVVEYTHEISLKNVDLVKSRFLIKGSSAARPRVGNLRLLAIE